MKLYEENAQWQPATSRRETCWGGTTSSRASLSPWPCGFQQPEKQLAISTLLLWLQSDLMESNKYINHSDRCSRSFLWNRWDKRPFNDELIKRTGRRRVEEIYKHTGVMTKDVTQNLALGKHGRAWTGHQSPECPSYSSWLILCLLKCKTEWVTTFMRLQNSNLLWFSSRMKSKPALGTLVGKVPKLFSKVYKKSAIKYILQILY